MKREEKINLEDCPKNEYVDVYYSDGTLLAHTNDELEFNWIRLQIKKKGLSGCYIVFRGEKYEIDKYGVLEYQPLGCFDSLEMVLDELLDINRPKEKYNPFDVVLYKPTGEEGIVKRVTEDGVFVLFRIQSTANLCKFEDLELL